jgi:hypothetical protein
LGRTQHIASGTQPHYGVVALEVLFVEFATVFGSIHGYAIGFSPILKELNASLDGVVPPSCRFGKHQNSLLGKSGQGKETQ